MRPSSCLALITAAAAITVGALPASAVPGPPAAPAAVPVLTADGPDGAAVAAGDVLAAPLTAGTRATFYSTATSTTGVTCGASQFTATVLTNPDAPGTATESLTGMAFSSCTSNVTGVTAVKSLTVGNLPYTVSVADSAGLPVALTAGPTGPIQAAAVLSTWFGTLTCTYRLSGDFTGSADNTAHSLSFRNEHFAKSSGSSLCPADGYFSAAYGPVTDTSRTGNPAVHIN